MSAILLLGGRSAIGLAVVRELLRVHGPADVVLAQRGGSSGSGTSGSGSSVAADAQERELRDAGARAVQLVDFDAAALEAHEALVQRVFAEHRVSHAVVAFGILGDQEQAWQDVASAQRLLQVNATAAVGVGVALADAMRRQASGAIVAISSVAGVRVRRSNFVYGASKQAMDSFYLNLGVALRGSGVDVLVVRPGAIRSPMTEGRPPVAFTREADDVARAAVAALERRRPVVHVPGGFGPALWLAQLAPLRLWMRVKA